MLILIRSSTRQKVYLALRLLIVVTLLSLIIFQLSGLFKGYTLSSGGWLKEDNPSGSSIRVEKMKKEKIKNSQKPNKEKAPQTKSE